jgi:hypothetical protein
MIVANFYPGATVNCRVSEGLPFIRHSSEVPTGTALSSSIGELVWEVNNSSTWIKAPLATPPSQASSTYWPGPSSMEELEWEEDFSVPFRPRKTVRITARMRYIGRYQPKSLDIEEYELD